MKFFIDTANVDEIREISKWGILDGVTTNPSLIAKEGRDFVKLLLKSLQSLTDLFQQKLSVLKRKEW